MDLLSDCASLTMLGYTQVIVRLQIEPKLSGRAEVPG